MIELGQIVLKGVIMVQNEVIRLYGLERRQLGTQYESQVIWS